MFTLSHQINLNLKRRDLFLHNFMNINIVLSEPYPVNFGDSYGCLDKCFMSFGIGSNLYYRLNICIVDLSLTCCNGWDDVLAHKQAIPFWRFCGGVGRTAHAENRYSNGQGPLDLLKNVESNAEVLREEEEQAAVDAMVKYSREPVNPTKSCKARGSDLRVHFKNTRETAFAIRKLPLVKAKRYLEDVLAHKQAIPFRRFCGGVGRTAQAKNRHSNGQGRWPVKSAKFILDLLKNAESNAEVKGLDVDALYISHIQVNQAQKQRRRTYRAHGRINPYMSSPCHIELILSEKEEPVKKEPESQLATSKKSQGLRSGASS
ncbi:hypothetical protein Ahy_A03g015020 isoform C [Arachis hypogaea]|uniref:60S ribosomal protein L17-2 n=1 Tax=Arachis hypogaea TaxID=3818 RepID=A0A445DZD9_ARAHY|nr:hypothetical protein Ahy_A03g015020 isoform C [Arachis hypogaea]